MKRDYEKHNLGVFFEMLDLIEDDISEMLESEDIKLNGSGCIIISFNCLTLFSDRLGLIFIKLRKFKVSVKKTPDKPLLRLYDKLDVECNEVEEFNMTLEEKENTLAAFKKRCKKTEELFD